jgi:hypothetical protein
MLPEQITTTTLKAGVMLHLTVRNTGTVDASKALLFFAAVQLSGGNTTSAVSYSWKTPRRSLFAISKVHSV